MDELSAGICCFQSWTCVVLFHHTDLKIKDYVFYIQTIDTSIALFRRTLLACFLSCYLLHMSQLQWKKIYTWTRGGRIC